MDEVTSPCGRYSTTGSRDLLHYRNAEVILPLILSVSSEFTNVFVYGTLKRGQCLHHVLADQEFLGQAQTKPVYVMVSLGDFPGLVLPEAFSGDVNGVSIEGELYRVDRDCLAELDRVECVGENMYQRRLVSLQTPADIVAETYFYQPAVNASMICGPSW